MTEISIITDRVAVVDAVVDSDRNTFLIAEGDLSEALGWELKPSGLCQGDTCVPVRNMESIRVGDRLDVAAVAAAVASGEELDLCEVLHKAES